jgi:hypothetical protein
MHVGGKPDYTSLQQSLPSSRMVFPSAMLDRIKYVIWRIYTPAHPFFRELFTTVGIVSLRAKAQRWGERQDYLIGTIAPGETIESVVEHLVAQDYGNHFIAWRDQGEVVGLRYVEDFKYQYHVRIFEDGEVRAHYEYTPESYLIRHNKAEGFEDRREYFLRVLGGKITPAARS